MTSLLTRNSCDACCYLKHDGLAVVQAEQASTTSRSTSYSVLDSLRRGQLAPLSTAAEVAKAAAQQLDAQAVQTHGPAKPSDYLSSLQVGFTCLVKLKRVSFNACVRHSA